ncbi:MAG: hypothetical protein ABJB39_00055 [Chloroflexota bacterium]
MRVLALVGAGILVLMIVVAVVVLGPRATVAESATPTATIVAPSTPTLTPTPSVASSSAAPTSPQRDLASLLRPLVASWRPAAPVLLVERSDNPGATLLAVPIAGGPATPLVALPSVVDLGYELRNDGSALAAALPITTNTSRIAIWEPASGTTRWLTAEEPGVMHITPIWSEDGSLIYYAASAFNAQINRMMDLGIFSVRADGKLKTRVRAPEENGAQLRGITPDGHGLWWDRIRAGGAVEVLDLASGQNHSFDETTTARVLSWRRAQPRALVMVGGCCAGRPGGSLALWDDTTGSSKTMVGPQSTPPAAVISAAWEPNGARFAAVVLAGLGYLGSVVIYGADGQRMAPVAGTDDAQEVLWLPPGIAVKRVMPTGGMEIVLIPPSGETLVLYRDARSFFIRSIAAP